MSRDATRYSGAAQLAANKRRRGKLKEEAAKKGER